MFTLDKTQSIDSPESLLEPQKDHWGIEFRKHTFFDFITPLVSLVALSLGFFLNLHPEISKDPRVDGLGITLMVIFIPVFLISLMYSVNRPKSEAGHVARNRSIDWQKDYLLPYLERKYDITFGPGTDFFGLYSVHATKNGKYIQVRLENVERFSNHTYHQDIDYFYEYNFPYSHGPVLTIKETKEVTKKVTESVFVPLKVT